MLYLTMGRAVAGPLVGTSRGACAQRRCRRHIVTPVLANNLASI